MEFITNLRKWVAYKLYPQYSIEAAQNKAHRDSLKRSLVFYEGELTRVLALVHQMKQACVSNNSDYATRQRIIFMCDSATDRRTANDRDKSGTTADQYDDPLYGNPQ